MAGAFFAAVVVFFAGAFLAAVVVLAGAFFAGVFLAGAFFAGAFFAGAADFAGAFFAGAFFAGPAFFTALAAFAAGAAAALAAEPALATVSLGSFLAPEMTFFRSWPGVNFGTAVFLAFIRSPVRGLRTHRASRTFFSNEPKPVMATFSPFATSRVMVSRTDSSAWAAAFLFPSKRAESASMSWVLFTGFPFVQTSVRRARARTSHAR